MFDKYKFIGLFYDFACDLMTAKAIRKCRVCHLKEINPGDKVLFAGVGYGKDAIFAAQQGAQVTVVDLSKTMLKKFNRELKKSNFHYPIQQFHIDILEFKEFNQFDTVVANFFLNVFPRKKMIKVLSHLISQGKIGAKIIVGDFSYPNNGLFSNFFQNTYWFLVVLFFRVFSGNAMHKIYNYPKVMQELGLKIISTKKIKFLNLNLFSSVAGEKNTLACPK